MIFTSAGFEIFCPAKFSSTGILVMIKLGQSWSLLLFNNLLLVQRTRRELAMRRTPVMTWRLARARPVERG